MKLAKMILVASFLLVPLAACGGDDSTPAPDAAAGPDGSLTDATPSSVQVVDCASATVAATIDSTMTPFTFTPNTATINAGEVVKFISDPIHNVLSGTPPTTDGKFSTTDGSTVCLKFTEAGSFPFFCMHHTSMTGTITVN
jgi:plastocyanin